MNYTVNLSKTEDAALSYAAFSPQEWIDNVVHERCRIAIDEIAKITVEKCLETGTPIPGSKDDMVALAFEQGWVKSAAERNAEAEAEADAAAAAAATEAVEIERTDIDTDSV